jgi:16S rRNA (guanine966-N2)-methyltransferase
MTRIIGGSAGGRRITAPSGSHTRPTTDRVREALFSSIEAWCGSLQGLRFLDLYAGSGAVGLEAWSRGAGVVTLVESDRRTARLIEQNARALGFAKPDVVAAAVAATLATPPAAPYDVVFMDPPYPVDDASVAEELALLVDQGWLVPGAMVVVERSSRSPQPAWPPQVTGARSRRYGETTLWYGHAARTTPKEREAAVVRTAVCPGSFDPVTNGHLDIIERASALFDEVVVAVGVNKSKNRLFSAEERISMLEKATEGYANVSVAAFTGLLTTFCQEREAHAIVKGLRAVSDYEYELQMAQMNASLTGVETVFVPTSPEWSFLASSLVKEVAMFGGDVSRLVPGLVLGPLTERLAERRAAGDH